MPWALLAARRGLPLDNPTTTRALLDRSAPLPGSDRISAQSRQELTSIVYSLRADGLTGTGTELEPYLALPPGWGVVLAPDYEDVWYDEALLDV